MESSLGWMGSFEILAKTLILRNRTRHLLSTYCKITILEEKFYNCFSLCMQFAGIPSHTFNVKAVVGKNVEIRKLLPRKFNNLVGNYAFSNKEIYKK